MATVIRPRLLDLFCGAGGAAMGYYRSGFDVVGVDLNPQPRYPFDFVQGDALAWLEDWGIDGFDAIHASPPCQHASTIGKQQRTRSNYDHPNLIPQTRESLRQAGLPYVIENVVGAHLIEPAQLCGSSFGLDVRRHRLFETSFRLLVPSCVHGVHSPRFHSPDRRRSGRLASVVAVYGHGHYAGQQAQRATAMEIDWMTPSELTQAVPPVYTELIGYQLRAHIQNLNQRGEASLSIRTANSQARPEQ